MSIARHPNIHAVALTVDIITAIETHVRGKAAELPPGHVQGITSVLLVQFVAQISTLLDIAVGDITP